MANEHISHDTNQKKLALQDHESPLALSLEQLLLQINDTTVPFPDDRCAHELFEEQAATRPHAVALEFEQVQLTYAELNERANRLARYLKRFGVGPDVLVGICVERSVEMIVGLLGILKAGGAYVPLDPAYPLERLQYMVEDSGVPVLMTKQHWLDRLPNGQAQVICLDTQEAEIARESADNLPIQATAGNLAYVIYTSGSTGKPKGVLLNHRGLCNMIPATCKAFDVREDSRSLQFASFSFDAATNEIFTVLSAGGTLCLASKEALMPGPSLIGLLRDLRITNVILPPSVLALLPDGEEFPHLRNIVSAGESCTVDLVQRWSRGRRFVNGYGPTEATVCASAAVYTNGQCEKVTIGQPIDNTQLYVLDAQLQPLPVGDEGELHIGGVGVARGYLNRPELTEEKFIRNPFSNDANDRLYKTGDLVRLLPDGNLEFLGRIDHQIKIRGFRIELGEIEELLLQHESVRESVLVAREDVPGTKQLVAYVVGQEQTERPTAGMLRRFLQGRLPEYMVPSAFVVLDRFPLTPNGKVDRKALPAPERIRGDMESEFVAPRTPLEESLVSIWQEVMGVEQLGVLDPFLDLGGYSLMAVKILARVRERLQIDLPLQLLFSSATVAQMAQEIEAVRRRGETVHMGSIPRVPRTGDMPLAFAQERVWFVHKMNPENRAYAAQAMMRFRGNLRIGVLEQTLSAMVERHEMFRTTFHEAEERPVQRIHAPFAVQLPVVNLMDVAESEREAKLQELMLEEMLRPFDMSQLPLVRWTLYQVSADEHVLLHIEHHMVHDGWSYNVFLREFTELYQAFSKGEPSPLAEMPIQFADFAHWHHEWLQGEQAAEQIAFWKKTLSGCQSVLELPTDHPRPALPSYRGSSIRVELPVELVDALHALSRQEGSTLYVTMLAAFNVLLYRYTGQEDLLVGSGVANRRLHDVEGLIGMIVNNVALRAQVSADMTFRELMAQVRETAFGAFSHEDLPFDKLVEAVNPVRDVSRNPLVQVMFSFHDSPMPHIALPDVEVEIKEVLSNGSAKFDLNVVGIPHPVPRRSVLAADGAPVGLTMVFEFSSDLFEKATIERMIEHYRTLLASVLADPGQTLSKMPLLPPAEQQQVLVEWNDTATNYPRELTIHQLFEAQAEQTPDVIALIFNDQQMTYCELNARANQAAHLLQEQGVESGTLVGLCMERSLEMVVGLLGILKAGAAYLPLDPSYPAERLSFMLEDANVSMLLTQTHLVSALPPLEAQVFALDADFANIAEHKEENVPIRVNAEDLAYVIYTSGSTGRPKGVCVPHRAVVRLVKETNYVEFSPDEVFLQFAPISFDAATFEIWGSLLNGARLVVFPAHKPSLEELGQVIAEYGVSTLWLTAGLFQQMVDGHLEALRPVRQLLAGGDALSVPHVKRVLETLDVKLINGYGPTENTTFTTCYVMTEPEQVGNTVWIGRPIANTEVYILDQTLQPVPIGVPGELCVGGDGLAHGYLNRPELTAEKFISHPFSDRTGAKLYRTGDLVRYLPNGNLEFLGRIDKQVKIRGFRIELGEIEHELGVHPDLQTAVVTVREDVPGDKRLVAYAVVRETASLTPPELRRYLKERLPDYMIPSAFVIVEQLPLTANGKLDYRALPAPDRSLLVEQEYVAPRTAREQTVAAIFAEVLGVEQVGVYDSFFDLGGHSLLATRILSRLRDAYQVDIPFRTIFEEPTVAGLVQWLEHQATQAELPQIVPISRDQPLPLSFAQQRLWFVDRLLPGNPAYNVPFALRLHGKFDRSALQRSLQEIVQRHEALRTTFAEGDNGPVQLITDTHTLTIAVHDLRHVAGELREGKLQRLIRQEARRSFDLEHGPLFRASLVQLDEQEHVLILNLHHIVSDGWSMGVFAQEMAALYGAFANNQESPLSPLPVQYAEFAVMQREWLRDEVLEKQLAYWRDQLAGELPVLQLPTDFPRPAVQTYNGAFRTFPIPSHLVQALQALSQQEGSTMFMTLLSVFKTLLYRYTGQGDVLVGTPISGRNHSEIEGLIGFFVNSLVLRSNLANNPTFRELLKQVREVAIRAYAHQDVPFEKLVEELQPDRDMSHAPLFQVTFQSVALGDFQLPGLDVQPLDVETGTAKFDITVTIIENSQGLIGRFDYNTDLFAEDTIARMQQHYLHLLEAIVQNPEQRIDELPLLTEAERYQLLVEWNQTGVPFPDHLCLHQLFEEQVLRTPHNVAALIGEQEMTYAELETKANQLAHHLLKLGVGPDVPVGVCMDRSLELVVALVGILKAGGAYVPLDTEAPTARLRQVLEDAQAFVCLTQEHLRAKLPREVATYVYLDTEADVLQQYSSEAPLVAVTPDHLVSIYYTSGSTGKPKGVCSTHRGWVNRMVWMQRQYQLEPHESVLQKTTLTFDDAACEFYWPLMVGARIALMEPGLHKDPRAILDAAIRYQVAFVTFVPSMLALVVDAITPQDRAQLKCLRHVGSSGEALRSDLVRTFRKRVGCDLHNTWGATEVSIDSTIHTCTEADEHVAEIVSVGRPIDNNTCYVLDKQLQPVPIGVAGDLYLGGIGLATGYLNDPERTAEAFIANPFVPGERMYKTGDRGYFRADGSIMFLGRRDDQVKVRGQRVELAEIEAVLATHPALKHAVVVAFKRPDGYLLAAYYVLHADDETGTDEQPVTAEALRAYMSERLPDYMVPWRFVRMDSLPTTVSGKIDRKLLPDPGDERPELAEGFVAPRTHTEQVIAAIWQEILDLKEVGIRDQFFELGGHSLTATRIISRINRELEVQLPLRDLFESPTVSGLAEKVERACNGTRKTRNQSIPRWPNRSEFPLSHAQQRFWFQYQFDKENMSYGVVNPHLIEGPVDTELLLKTYQALVQRHDIMRTTIAEREEGGAVQIVHAQVAEAVQFTDYSALSVDEQATAILQDIANEKKRQFDLTHDLFFHNHLFKLSADKHLLMLNVHPIAYDGWSITVFLHDLTALYRLLKAGRSATELSPALQYGEYSAWQHQQLESSELGAQMEYWQQKLAGDVEPPQLPYDFEEPCPDPQPMLIRKYAFDTNLVASLRKLSAEQGTTLYLTLLAGLNIWLSLVSEQEEITICSPISGRSHSELESVLGLMVNPLAMRTDLTGNPTGLTVLERVKETALGAYANQDYPFDRILHELRSRHGRNASQTLYTIVFVGQNAHVEALEIESGVTIKLCFPNQLIEELGFDSNTEAAKIAAATEEFADDPTVQFDLHIGAFEAGDQVTLHVMYNNQRFCADTVDQFLSQYEYVLQQFASDTELRLSQLELSELGDLF